MTMQLIDEATVKLALEALEANQPVNYCMNNNGEKFPMMHGDPFKFERNSKAITALREALASAAIEQPERSDNLISGLSDYLEGERYEQPAQRKPLTDEEIRYIHWSKPMNEYGFARAIEAAHGIKENT